MKEKSPMELLNRTGFDNLMAVAKVLEATSKNGYLYTVEGCWEDYGAGMYWETIIQCEADGTHRCQILSPREHEMISMATNAKELFEAVERIKNGEYFHD